MVSLIVIIEIVLISAQAFANDSCQVYPSEYAYLRNSVHRSESSSANCRPYASGLDDRSGVFTERYTHCDGTQLRLTDSDLGSEQCSSSDYYVWNAGTSGHQLLFIFPTGVNLSTITLHYYSANDRGLPRLRFSVVPDDFDVWDAPLASHSRVEIAAVPPDREPACRRNVSVNVNFVNAKKILMYKYVSSIVLAVSEVEFFTCIDIINHPCTMTNMMRTTTTGGNYYIKTTASHSTTDPFDDTPLINKTSTITKGPCTEYSQDQYENTSCICEGDTAAAWALFGVVTVLFIMSLTVNVIMVALWVYKKREVKGQTGRPSEFEIEGNPCYEATQMKQTTEAETHVYETVQGKRGK